MTPEEKDHNRVSWDLCGCNLTQDLVNRVISEVRGLSGPYVSIELTTVSNGIIPNLIVDYGEVAAILASAIEGHKDAIHQAKQAAYEEAAKICEDQEVLANQFVDRADRNKDEHTGRWQAERAWTAKVLADAIRKLAKGES